MVNISVMGEQVICVQIQAEYYYMSRELCFGKYEPLSGNTCEKSRTQIDQGGKLGFLYSFL